MSIWSRIQALVMRRRPGEQRIYVSPRQAGVTVTEDTALTLGEWWACVNVIARTVASLPWLVYEKTSEGRKKVDNQTAWLLNNQPNSEMTAFAFRETMMAHVLNWGNGYAEIEFDGAGRPLALWPITPDRICPQRDAETGALTYAVKDDHGIESILQPRQVLHIHGLGFDGLVGYSPVRMAARSIGIGIAQDTFGQAFYANGTAFGGLVEVPNTMSKEQIKDQEAYLNDSHRGPDKAFKIRIASAGMKYHATSMPMTDAQFIESRGMSITMAARWLGVPPHKIADLSRSTNNNIEHQGIEFVTDAIVPWAMRIEQEANIKLFGARSMGRVYTKMSVNALMRGDSKARGEFYRLMTQMGAMSINEVRELEELNGIGPAGDEHLVQLNQTTLKHLVENPGAKAAPAAPAVEGPAPQPEPAPSNVIRATALHWMRDQA